MTAIGKQRHLMYQPDGSNAPADIAAACLDQAKKVDHDCPDK
ncbi:hypothetical protein [Clavibacter michiganensis]|nr:hypothetical protein [Clavibacter michiganensis]